MDTVGDVLDDAIAESSFATSQTDLLDRRRWTWRARLAQAIFDFVEVFYNTNDGTRSSARSTPSPARRAPSAA